MNARLKITGLEALNRKLQNLASERKQATILRKAARAGIGPVVKALKREVPVDKGGLKKSQDRKITGKGFKVSAIAGADVNYVDADGEHPGKVDHLVVHGHVAPDGTVVPPNDFVSRAADASMDEAHAKYADKLADEIEKLAME